jgi:hypothetical protein
MKHEEYESLKKKVEKKSFFEEYKSLKDVGYWISILLQGVLMFFGYFFFKDVYTKIAEEPTGGIVVFIISAAIFTIALFEIIKRVIYSKFSKYFVEANFNFAGKGLIILFLSSLLMIAGSFYFSISGAKELSSKEKVMVTETKKDIKIYSDSLSKNYNDKIIKIEEQNGQLFNVNLTIQTRIDELPQWSRERNQYRKQIEGNKETIKNNESQIKELKSERDKSISVYEKDLNTELDVNKSENSNIIWIFVIGAVVVEIFVSTGIFFTFLYNTKSVQEYELKLKENTQYKTWEFHDKVLDLVFTFKHLKKGANLPPLKNFEDLAKAQGFIISKTQLTNVLKIFAHLDILNIKGSKKQLIVEEIEARKILKEHYKII